MNGSGNVVISKRDELFSAYGIEPSDGADAGYQLFASIIEDENADDLRDCILAGIDPTPVGDAPTLWSLAAKGAKTGIMALMVDAAGGMEPWATPLHRAILSNRTEEALALVKEGLYIHEPDECGQTPLHWAAAMGNAEVAARLLECGADVNAVAEGGFSPLCYAFRTGIDISYVDYVCSHNFPSMIPCALRSLQRRLDEKRLETIRLLVEHGADVKQAGVCSYGDGDEVALPPLFWATLYGKSDIACLLLDHGADPNVDFRGYFDLLQIAIHNRNVRLFRHMLRCGADPFHEVGDASAGKLAVAWEDLSFWDAIVQEGALAKCGDKGKLTALLNRMLFSRLSVENVRLLLEAGADASGDGEGGIPLQCALNRFRKDSAGLVDVVRLLLENGAGKTADAVIHRAACASYSISVLRLLLEYGADPDAKREKDWRPLHFVADKDKAALLLEYGADIGAKNNEGFTPLHMAAGARQEDVLSFLLERGADIHAKAWSGKTPLHSAASVGDAGIARILLEPGADIDSQMYDGTSALHIAVEEGGGELVATLLDHGAATNLKGVDGLSPLHLAVKAGKTVMARLLLEHGADVNARSYHGDTPLHLAAECGKSESVCLLLDHGADIHAQNISLATPIHCATRQCWGWNRNSDTPYDERIIDLLFQHGAAADINIRTLGHMPPLYAAAVSGRIDAAKMLLEMGADASRSVCCGSSPLHAAVGNDDLEMVKLLLSHGADIHATDCENGDTPLSKAVRKASLEIVSLLLESGAASDVNRDTWTATALGVAANNGDFKCMELLLDYGADIHAGKCFPLLGAVYAGETEIVRWLLEHGAEVDVNREPEPHDDFPLVVAVGNKSEEIVRLLLEHGADANIRKTGDFETPLDMALESGSGEIAALLRKYGAVQCPQRPPCVVESDAGEDADAQDATGLTPLHVAVLERSELTIYKLVAAGADIDARDARGRTPLLTALAEKQDEIAQLLLYYGADIHAKADDGSTVLHIAVENGRGLSMQLLLNRLLQSGADVYVNTPDAGGRTPLHLGAKNCDECTARMLLQHGADVNVRDAEGLTPLHIAAENEDVDTVRLLVEAGADANRISATESTEKH